MAKKKPHPQPRKVEIREASQERFLKAFAEIGYVTQAAAAAAISRSTHLKWLNDCPGYEERFEDARQQHIDAMAAECFRRAVKGTTEHVYYLGCKVDSVQKYSDNLLMFMLKAAEPHKYRDNQKSEDDADLTKQIAARLANMVKPSQENPPSTT